ncbi:MAG: hypothetical protein AAFU85_27840 [Planctomycetota bacterium]
MRFTFRQACSVVLLAVFAQMAVAQQVVTSVPFQNLNNSFYESTGINWSLQGNNWFANFGGGPPLLPAFGNPDPNAGLRSGVAFQRGGVSGSLGFSFAQGSNRSSVSTTPSVTTLNGAPGSISSQTISPFVTGITPVVGGYYGNPTEDNVSTQMLRSHQASQAAYLQSRVQANANAKQKRANEAFQRGLQAEDQGNLKMARANYRIALRADQGVLRQQILLRMRQRGWAK